MSVAEMSAAIRQAVLSGDFVRARDLLAGYCEAVEAAATTAPEVVAQARELLQWVRLMTLAARSQAAARLSGLHGIRSYGCRPSRIQTRQFDA